MALSWVIGSGGLLGSALQRSIQSNKFLQPFNPNFKFTWGNLNHLAIEFDNATKEFSTIVAGHSWQIYWAAGSGAMSSSKESLEKETEIVTLFLNFLKKNISPESSGAIFFSSSAGAIYAKHSKDLITENSPPSPNSHYGNEKILHERLFCDFSKVRPKISLLIGRLSTLYGIGQSSSKSQGLISALARNIIQKKPTHIYVPLDTIRDYLFCDDAAQEIINSLANLEYGEIKTKIFAAEKCTTISEIISVFSRISKIKPRIITSLSQNSQLYSPQTKFKSMYTKEYEKTPLYIGIARVFADELSQYAQPSDT